MDRRGFLKCSAIAGAAALTSGTETIAATLLSNKTVVASAGKNRPNIVILLTDDMGYSDLGCYNSPNIKTPNLDKLASEGMRFTESYAGAPLCSPARAALLTGRIPARTAVYSFIPVDTGHPMHLRTTEITIASLLQQAGYETAHFGKWHLNSSMDPVWGQPDPNDHGFGYYFGVCGKQANLDTGKRLDHNNYWRNGFFVGQQFDGYPCEVTVNDAMDWLETSRDKSKPFFMHVSFNEPHNPILEASDQPADIMAMYPPPIAETDACYFATVTNLDRHIGRFLDKLDELHLRENTFVVFLSDNGPLRDYSKQPLRGYKNECYEGGIRTPGIVRYPGYAKPGTLCNEPISFIDFAPTFCQMTGTKMPTDRPIDGTSFLPVFKGKRIYRKTPLFWYFYREFPQAAMRQGNWVMIGRLDADATEHRFHCSDMYFLKEKALVSFELYNIRKDIGQQNDLASVETKRFNAMKKKMIQLHQEVIDEGYTWPDSDFAGTEWDNCP